MSGSLRTARFQLRPLQADDPGDHDLYVALYTSPAVMARIMPPLDAAGAAAAFERTCRHNGRDTPGHRHWSVVEAASGQRAGVVGLLREGRCVEIGGVLLPAWWNRGVSREAYARIIDHAFEAMGVDLVFGERDDDAHARLIDRLFAPLGLARVRAGDRGDGRCRWELRQADWASRRQRP